MWLKKITIKINSFLAFIHRYCIIKVQLLRIFNMGKVINCFDRSVKIRMHISCYYRRLWIIYLISILLISILLNFKLFVVLFRSSIESFNIKLIFLRNIFWWIVFIITNVSNLNFLFDSHIGITNLIDLYLIIINVDWSFSFLVLKLGHNSILRTYE